MTRRNRIIRNILMGLGGLLLLIVVTALIVVNTSWFRNFVREQIITSTEDATGGKVEIGSFDFDVWSLRAVINHFVIHGNEPSGSAPFVQAARVETHIRLFTSIHHLLDIAYLGIQTPQVNVMVLPDGRTNIPVPKHKSTSNTSTLETVVDLAIGHFEVNNGLATYESVRQPLNVKANNLHAQLYYNILSQGYQGQLELEPLYVMSGRNTPVNFKVTLPVAMTKDRIDVHNAIVSTSVSSVSITGSVENMNNPKISAHVNGRIATIDLENAANLPLAVNARNVPSEIDLEANAAVANDSIDITGLRATLGQSNIEASGRLKDPHGNASFQFKTKLALGELGRLARLPQKPEGMVLLNGTAKLDASNNYSVAGNVDARNIAFQQGKERIAGVSLVSALNVDPHNLDLKGLRLSALGGDFLGNVSLQDFERYKVQGNLRNLDLATAARVAGQKIPYDGVISGPLALQGDTRAAGTKSMIATAHLAISPGRYGIPLSGKLNADYNGARDDVVVQNSFLALPHSRLSLSGSAGKQLNIALTSHDLKDLLAAANIQGAPPIALNPGGEADFTGAVTGGLRSPRITGHLALSRFSVEGRAFTSLASDVTVSETNAAANNGSLTRGAMQANFAANVGLHNWTAPPSAPVSANVSVINGDLADIMALAGQPSTGYSGALSANARIVGTVSNPQGSASLQATRGTVANEPFDQIVAQLNLADRLVTIPSAYVQSAAGRVNLTGEFQHPRDSFSTGRIHAHVQSNQINLAQIHAVQTRQPNSAGTLQLNADVNGTLSPSEFLLTSINADASARALKVEGQTYGDFTATAHTAGKTVSYNVNSDFAGSNIRLNGNTQLVHEYPTTADASIASLPIERMLALAKRTDILARGLLSGTAHVTGTMANPQGNADLDLSRAVVYNEPLDRVHARFTYLAQSIDLPQLEIAAGPSRIDLAAHYDHPAGNLQQGRLRFNVASSHIDLGRIHNIQSYRKGLGGTLDVNANGAAEIQEKLPRVLLSTLNANVAAIGISAQGTNYGDLKLTANTTGSNRLSFALDSDLAGASVHGRGTADLTGDYPVNAQLSFNNVAWTHIQNLIGTTAGGPPVFEATTAGEFTVSGPVLKTEQLNGTLRMTKLDFTTLPRPGAGRPITIANQGPISLALDHGTVRINSAHLTGRDTDLQATGTASLTTQALNLSVNGNADIGALQNFDRDIYSSGKIVLATTVRGTVSKPLVNGQLTLQGASFNYAQVPLGISNANGTVAFNGNNARIQNMTAESGGGKLTLTGFVGFADVLRFGLRAGATNVRVRVQEGVSVTADADIHLTGTSASSLVSGSATVQQVTYAPQSDIGSMLSRAAPPVQSPSAPSAILDNMRLDLRIRTAPGMSVQASLAQNLQADADIRVRGTAAQPGVLGRVAVNEGQLVFFGSQYTVDTGTISFYNPVRIEPILDISLETQAKGVTVTLRVTGPIDNMKLSYTSDPPLQFQEIVSLLASGRTPTSDPTVLANQPQQPAQGFQQMGESAIVGKALADPVSSRLERVFGVTQLKIDPSFTTGSDVPTARLTLQQRITNNLTFTYVSAIDDPNSTIVRIEFAFNPQFSAVATRDQNGIFSVNFFYKKQFR